MVRYNNQKPGGTRSDSNKGKSSFRGHAKKSTGDNSSVYEFSTDFYGGRVSLSLEFWRTLTGDPWVLETVKGYRLPFISNPPRSSTPAQL